MRSRSRPTAAPLTAALLLLTGWYAAGCHASLRPSGPSPAGIDRLRQHIDQILASPQLARGYWAIVVRSLGRDDTVYALNPDKLLLPASNLKIVTLAVAADHLGWDYTYATHVATRAAVEDGVVRGDLVIAGTGDPSLSDRDGGALAELAGAVRARGVRRVDGEVVADGRTLGQPLGSGWAWDDVAEAYSAPVGGLQLDENTVLVTVTPGPRTGDEAALSVVPPGGGVTIRNLVMTGPADREASVAVRPRSDGQAGVEIVGSVPLGGQAVSRRVAVPDPERFVALQFRRALIAAGVDVRGGAVAVPSEAPAGAPGTVLATHRSAPLSTLAQRLMKASQNQYAEILLRTIAKHAGRPATADAGLDIVRSTLSSWGVKAGSLVMADGSGLSRYNHVTAETLAAVLAHVYSDQRLRDPFVASLPLAGRDGSLSRRMAGTIADGRVHAKTGSLTGVRTLSGYVETTGGETLVFSILANNFEIAADDIDRATDGIVVALAGFSR